MPPKTSEILKTRLNIRIKLTPQLYLDLGYAGARRGEEIFIFYIKQVNQLVLFLAQVTGL